MPQHMLLNDTMKRAMGLAVESTTIFLLEVQLRSSHRVLSLSKGRDAKTVVEQKKLINKKLHSSRNRFEFIKVAVFFIGVIHEMIKV